MPATKAQVLIKEFVIHHEGILSLTSKLCSVSPSGTSSRIEPMSPVPPKPTSYPLGILESTFAPSNASAAAPTSNRRICNWFDWKQDRIPLPDHHGGRSSPAAPTRSVRIATGA
jgi:hypothetical protein